MELVSPISTRRRIPNVRLGIFMTALILLVGAIGLGKTEGFEWFVLKNAVRMKYPSVRRITSEQLAAWLSDMTREQPVLLDVRSDAEWNISHLSGARRVDPDASGELAAAGIAKDAPIVTYCTVGYRSSELARRLHAAGYTNVFNLEGSIFAWANEGRPLVSARGEKATRVHPHNSWWGRLLNEEVRGEETAPR